MPFLDRMSGKAKPKKSIFDLAGYKEAAKNPYVKQALGPVADAMSTPKIPEGVNADKAKPYLPLFEQAAKDTGIDVGLLLKQAQTESSFNPTAKSKAGAEGLMQVIPKHHPEIKDPTNPTEAIPYAAKYLKGLMDRFDGDIRKALAAYNWGPTNLSKLLDKRGDNWEDHLPDETKGYLTKIVGERTEDVYEDQNGRQYKYVNGSLVEAD